MSVVKYNDSVKIGKKIEWFANTFTSMKISYYILVIIFIPKV